MIIKPEFVKGKKADKDVHLKALPLITQRGPMRDKFGITVKFSNIQNHQKGNELLRKTARALSLDVFKIWLLNIY